MNPSPRSAPGGISPVVARLLVLAAAASGLGCGSSNRTGLEPEATLAASTEAQTAYRALNERWVGSAPAARAALGPELIRFVQRYPDEAPSRRVRIYLAWIGLSQDRPADAEQWLEVADTGAAGSAADLLSVVRAALALHRGGAAEAHASLLALQGRLVDDDDRLLCLDRLVLAALAAGLYPQAVAHILELAAQSARRHRERVWRGLATELSRVPLPVLEQSAGALTIASIESPTVLRSERVAATTWLRREIRGILSRSAIDQHDVGLAQRLVADASRSDSDRSQSSELLWLATQGQVAPRVRGRTLGLALQLGDNSARQRSLEVATGISLALDPAGNPAERSLRLETRPVGEESGGLSEALARLAGAGATLLAAGVDAEGAREAAAFSAQQGVPVLLLHDPELGSQPLAERAFVIGSSAAAANAPLTRFLEQHNRSLSLVGSAESPCPDAGATPSGDWGGSDDAALVFVGGAHCARNTLMGLGSPARSRRLGVGLDALPLLGDDLKPHWVWATTTGRVPLFEGVEHDEDLNRFRSLKGRSPGWYEALGHDVATLGQISIPQLAADDETTATEAHRLVHDALVAATLTGLWTSARERFSPKRRLQHTFRVVRVLPPEAP